MVISVSKFLGAFRTKLRHNRRKYGRSLNRGLLNSGAEQLEIRSLLSNTVLISLSSGGALDFQGDDQSNGIEIHVDSVGIHATGSSALDTQIKFQGQTYAPGTEVLLTTGQTLSNFNAGLKSGNDNFLIRVDSGTLIDSGYMVINGNSGNDTITVSTASGATLDIGVDLIVYGGGGDDRIVAATDEALNNLSTGDPSAVFNGSKDITTQSRFVMLGQGGNDILVLGGASAGTTIKLEGGAGSDHVGVSDVQVTSTMVVDTGDGNDCFVGSNLNVGGQLIVRDPSGINKVGLFQSSLAGVLTVKLGTGTDQLRLDTVNVNGSLVSLYGGAGHDSLQSNIDLSNAQIYSFDNQNAAIDFSDCLAVFH